MKRVFPTEAGNSQLRVLLDRDFELEPFEEVVRIMAGNTFMASAKGGLTLGPPVARIGATSVTPFLGGPVSSSPKKLLGTTSVSPVLVGSFKSSLTEDVSLLKIYRWILLKFIRPFK